MAYAVISSFVAYAVISSFVAYVVVNLGVYGPFIPGRTKFPCKFGYYDQSLAHPGCAKPHVCAVSSPSKGCSPELFFPLGCT